MPKISFGLFALAALVAQGVRVRSLQYCYLVAGTHHPRVTYFSINRREILFDKEGSSIGSPSESQLVEGYSNISLPWFNHPLPDPKEVKVEYPNYESAKAAAKSQLLRLRRTPSCR